jgi:hypothetical protein
MISDERSRRHYPRPRLRRVHGIRAGTESELESKQDSVYVILNLRLIALPGAELVAGLQAGALPSGTLSPRC